MNKEKDFFKTCFNKVAGLEVKNESQAIAKEVVLSEIENLQQENKILKENAENNDKVVDKVNWENMLLKKENQELKKQLKEYKNPIKYFKYANKNVTEENKQLKDNWIKLKEYCKENTLCYEIGDDENTKLIGSKIHGLNVLDKMQELEQGSDK